MELPRGNGAESLGEFSVARFRGGSKGNFDSKDPQVLLEPNQQN